VQRIIGVKVPTPIRVLSRIARLGKSLQLRPEMAGFICKVFQTITNTILVNLRNLYPHDPFMLPQNPIPAPSIDVFVRVYSAEFAPVRTGILIL
jgi:hypothetical protein